jgi:hypothetical protein
MGISRCPVCGCSELRSDEVYDRGLLLLTECPRCEHRTALRVPSLPRRIRFEAEEAGAEAAA